MGIEKTEANERIKFFITADKAGVVEVGIHGRNQTLQFMEEELDLFISGLERFRQTLKAGQINN